MTIEASARHQIAVNNLVTQKGSPPAAPYVDMQKHFFEGDQGITVCTYPNGKIGTGMHYTNLVSTGFTSPVIAGLMLDRNMKDGMAVNGYIRTRHDGRHRSPWNEPECGLLYSRAMAHWNIYDQACGHVYDAVSGALSFDPRAQATLADGTTHFSCFAIVEGGWGEFTATGPSGLGSGSLSLRCVNNGAAPSEPEYDAGGGMSLMSLGVVSTATSATAALSSAGAETPAAVPCTIKGGVISFTGGVTITVGATLTVTLKGGAEDEPSPYDVLSCSCATCQAHSAPSVQTDTWRLWTSTGTTCCP